MIDFLKGIIDLLISFLSKALNWIIEHFLDRDIYEKLIILLALPAFFAVIKPSARYRIYDSWFYINNPIAENLIGIIVLTAISFLIPPLAAVLIRTLPSAAYLLWTIFLQATRGISKAPYELTWWHFLNLLVPALVIVFSLLSYFRFGKTKG